METSKLTTTELKRMNRSKVFSTVYATGSLSKQSLAQTLNLSLPTVTQNLKELQELGLIERSGLYESTGGRKAQIISCVNTARVSVGVEILKSMAYILAVDLYGNPLKEDILEQPFSNAEPYYMVLGEWVNAFMQSLPYPSPSILGIGVAIQGLISPDGATVTFGNILDCTGATLENFSRHIHWPVRLLHDAEVAAFAELWHQKGIRDAAYFSLNRNMGAAVIINHTIHRGHMQHCGTIEHMCLVPGGRPCYCGQRGCVEAYCSADALQAEAHMELDDFFCGVRAGNPRETEIWREYLSYLALTINNVRMVMDSDFIIAGLLQHYITAEDIALLNAMARRVSAFESQDITLIQGICGRHAAANGAALMYMDEFLRSI